MIKRILLICFLVSMAAIVYGFGLAPKITVTVHVVDENGIPAEDVLVKGAFYGRSSADDKGPPEKAHTDSKGLAILKGRTFFPVSVYATKEGYYETRLKDITIQRRENGKDIYFDPDVNLVIRKIKKPIPMYARKEVKIALPVVNQPVGFDLIECDLVAPYGKGKHSDFIFEVSGYANNRNDYEANVKATFPSQGDGIIPFDGFFTSELRSPYDAPATGYQPTKTWQRSRKPNPNADYQKGIPAITGIYPNERASYFFRVRTKLDAKGNVTEALYGKIYGDLYPGIGDGKGGLIMTYYLNPTPNDRNVEFDTKQNLFKNLKDLDKVMNP